MQSPSRLEHIHAPCNVDRRSCADIVYTTEDLEISEKTMDDLVEQYVKRPHEGAATGTPR